MSCERCALLEAQLNLQQQVIRDLAAGMQIMSVNAIAMLKNCQPIEEQLPNEVA